MTEDTVEPVKKRRGWPLGKPRGKKVAVTPPLFTAAPEPEAPIHVRLRLKNYPEAIEFGCAERTIENGFHVFTYPSERDRYRTTRREFAISEIIEIEITAARHQVEIPMPPQYQFSEQRPSLIVDGGPSTTNLQRGPVIHSVKRNAAGLLGALETSSGPVKMDAMPNLTFGDSAIG